MLSPQDNEYLCRIGPGTPMGNLFRQYWLPAITLRRAAVAGLPAAARQAAGRGAHRLPHDLRRGRPDAELLPAPRRLDVLRPQRGRRPALRLPRLEVRRRRQLRRHAVGAGRVATSRTRCTPRAYPTRERNGVIWAYMGPRETPPPLPELEANMLREDESPSTVLLPRQQLDAGLGGRDGHRPRGLPARRRHPGAKTPSRARSATTRSQLARRQVQRHATPSSARPTACTAPAEEDSYYWRIGHMLFPCYAMVPPGTLGQDAALPAPTCRWTTTTRWSGACSPAAATPAAAQRRRAAHRRRPRVPAQRHGLVRPLPHRRRTWHNDFLIDREAQTTWKSYTGIARHPPAGHGDDREHGPDL